MQTAKSQRENNECQIDLESPTASRPKYRARLTGVPGVTWTDLETRPYPMRSTLLDLSVMRVPQKKQLL